MIQKIVPLAFDSLGVRSMATFIETDDLKILIDPGAALGPIRYGLPPHFLEWQKLDEAWKRIKRQAKEADVLMVTHYHYDHHDPDAPELYKNKIVFIKHPTENINLSQRERAALFLKAIREKPKKLEVADGKNFRIGKTHITFSKAVCHGTNPRLGYVTEVSIKSGNDKFLYTSDVEGPSLPEQIKFILKEKPDILFIDGPMTYMLGFRYSYKSLEISNNNLVKAINKLSLNTLVLDHHFLRDLNYKLRIKPVYEAAEKRKVKVVTAAEFCGRKIEMLEALRKELYAKYGDKKGKNNNFS
ncbi:MAG: MBL fold metallo-hydrolase [Candidatus Bathyarchaeota archaeon]|jgi:predicted metallo-beta-lactamase superfamily hydrolase|nr:MBL fold metallo-hydrolase [Candidatus Bathyarchaeota archaeon A05DMB-5]MDH7558540.1 MBL fold metallo-hydrolase [Candidatus Bathyarchaeota archaeon]